MNLLSECYGHNTQRFIFLLYNSITHNILKIIEYYFVPVKTHGHKLSIIRENLWNIDGLNIMVPIYLTGNSVIHAHTYVIVVCFPIAKWCKHTPVLMYARQILGFNLQYIATVNVHIHGWNEDIFKRKIIREKILQMT
jgi:hypothetical protein